MANLTNRPQIFQAIIKSTLDGDAGTVLKMIRHGLKLGLSAEEIMEKALIPASTQVAKKFEGAQFYIAEILMSSNAIETGLFALKPYIRKSHQNPKKVVIGTVAGDLHDIGKNLVAFSFSFAGFEVIDLGVNVSALQFVHAVKHHKPNIIAMSALLTTTMCEVANVIEALEENSMRNMVKVLVGGGPVTREFALSVGADGYAEYAQGAINEAERLVG